jgi:hypothetical protein
MIYDENAELQEACYITYSANCQEVIGTLRHGQPTYSGPIYLELLPERMPQPLGDKQLHHLSLTDPHVYAVDEALHDINNPHLEAEISHLWQCIESHAQLKKQWDDIDEQSHHLTGLLFDNNLKLQGIRDCLE